MQERYLGDVHDFVKFALLRHFGRTLDVRLGVNWYLTDPRKVDKEGSKDGGDRDFLCKEEWKGHELYQALQHFEDPANRSLERFQESNILPENTLFFDKEIPFLDKRKGWHNRAMEKLTEAELIFLDPDTGFQVKSMESKKAPKYTLYDEAMDYYQSGKTVLIIQFIRQRSRKECIREVRGKLGVHADSVPVIRGRVAPNILFFTLAQPDHIKPLVDALPDFAKNSPHMKRGRRIEIER